MFTPMTLKTLVKVLPVGVLDALELDKRLVCDLGGHLIVGESGSGYDRGLLVAQDGVHGVDGGDAGLDHNL